jgi:hypothetical protein
MAMNTNTCNGCTACCWAADIDNGEKKPMFNPPCRYMTGTGCAIHESPERAEVCRTWKCHWLVGVFGYSDKWRPDRCGIMVCTGRITGRNDKQFIMFTGLTPTAFANADRVNYLWQRLIGHRLWNGTLPSYVMLHPYGLTDEGPVCRTPAPWPYGYTRLPKGGTPQIAGEVLLGTLRETQQHPRPNTGRAA